MVEKLRLLTYAVQSSGNLGTENQVNFLLLSFCKSLIHFYIAYVREEQI